MSLGAVPSLDELAAHPERAAELTADAVLSLHARAVRALVALEGPLLAGRSNGAERAEPPCALLLTVEQAAERANVPVSWIRTVVKDGRLLSRKLGHYRRIHPDDLARFIEQSRAEDSLTCRGKE